MGFNWQIKQSDVDCVNRLMEERKNCSIVRARVKKNLAERKPEVKKEKLWQAMLSMRLTTRQHSGPDGAVFRFYTTEPFPLPYDLVSKQEDPASFITNTLNEHGGINYANQIGRQMKENLSILEDASQSDDILASVNRLTKLQSKDVEREVARKILCFKGFGPKQARNVLQFIGLTRFEIPIDSRMINWINENTSFPLELDAGLLQSGTGYEAVLDEFQRLCELCDEFPCLVDGVIFASVDGDEWDVDSDTGYERPRPSDN